MNQEKRKELENELLEEESLPLPINTIIDQVELFEKGIPYLKLLKPCLVFFYVPLEEKPIYDNDAH